MTATTMPYGDSAMDIEPVSERVVERRMPNPDDPVKICHMPPGNPDNEHTIVVDRESVPAHLAHGDSEGKCDDDDEASIDEGDGDDEPWWLQRRRR